jgi:hypothetical protein
MFMRSTDDDDDDARRRWTVLVANADAATAAGVVRLVVIADEVANACAGGGLHDRKSTAESTAEAEMEAFMLALPRPSGDTVMVALSRARVGAFVTIECCCAELLVSAIVW